MDGGSVRTGAGRPEQSGGKRGAIAGWSKKSRQRMREWLISHAAPEGWGTWGYTLTIPGEDVGSATPEVAGECLRQFGQALKRAGGASAWRLELQKRDMPHYHGLMIAPACGLKRGGRFVDPGEWVRDTWLDLVDRLIPCAVPWRAVRIRAGRYRVEYMGGQFENADGIFRRSDMDGAREHAVKVDQDNGTGAWLRYIQDHSTKAKQEQEPGAGWGRHWGIIGRERFARVKGRRIHELTQVEYARVQRWLRRAKRLLLKDERCLFGVRFGYTSKRGNYGAGAAVVFTSTRMVERMAQLARELTKRDGREYVMAPVGWRRRLVDKKRVAKVA